MKESVMPRVRLSVATKLLILIFLVGLVPSGAALVLFYFSTLTTTRETLAAQLLERAQGMRAVVDERLLESFQASENVARHLPSRIETTAIEAAVKGLLDGWVILDEERKVVDAVPTSLVDVLSLPERVFSPARSELPFVDEVSTGPLAPALRIFLPASQNRVFVGWINIPRLVETFGMSLPGDETQVLLATNRRNIITRATPAPEVVAALFHEAQQSPGSLADWLLVSGAQKAEYLAAFSASTFLRQRQKLAQTTVDWLAIAYIDTQFVLPVLNAMLWRMGLWGIVVVCLLTVLSASVSTTFLRSLRQLHHRVEQITKGDWEGEAVVRTGDEVEELANAFNRMLAEIRSSRQALERQIEQTREHATQVEIVNKISQELLSSFSIQKLLSVAFLHFSQLVPTHRVFIAIQRELRWDVRGEPSIAANESAAVIFSENFLDAIWEEMTVSGRDVLTRTVNDNRKERSFAILRLAPARERLGLFVIECKENATLSESQMQLLIQLVPFLALCVRHLRLFEQVFDLAADLERKVEERAAQLREAHQRLLESERLAVTGQLAAGVAHEINNPLAIIKNLVQLLRLKRELNLDTLRAIEEEIDRIARIVRGLLDFARPPVSGGAPARLSEELKRVQELLGPTLAKKHIELRTEIPDNLPQLSLSSDHLSQVLLNLLRNAEQAIGSDGTIFVRARVAEVPNGAPYVVIEVEDTGPGIPPDVLPKIFEPFFTTKRHKEGMGLGLAVTQRLIVSVGGKIEVESTPGQGTTFRVSIPSQIMESEAAMP